MRECRRWWLLDRDGAIVPVEDFGVRPQDARAPDLLEDGSPDLATPWYATESHLHLDEEGRVVGIHAYGSLEEVRSTLRAALEGADVGLVGRPG